MNFFYFFQRPFLVICGWKANKTNRKLSLLNQSDS